jgi:hypothetical protein
MKEGDRGRRREDGREEGLTWIRMRAVGNSLRLKKRFGAGYHIQLVTTPQQVDDVKQKVKEMLPG